MIHLAWSPPNRSLNLTPPRAEFSVRSEYSEGSMLNLKQVLGYNSKNVTATAVQNACLPKWVVQHFNKTKWPHAGRGAAVRPPLGGRDLVPMQSLGRS